MRSFKFINLLFVLLVLVLALPVVGFARQIVTVYGDENSSRAQLKFGEYSSDSKYTEYFSTEAIVGKNGITFNKKEGDAKTPAGRYTLGYLFGIEHNPGAKLPYRQVTEDDYWVDDVESIYYNKWVNVKQVKKDWTSAEHLVDYPRQYAYAAVIGYNTEDIVVGAGSAIFLHCTATKNYTAGCVAIPTEAMKVIVKKLKPGAEIDIKIR